MSFPLLRFSSAIRRTTLRVPRTRHQVPLTDPTSGAAVTPDSTTHLTPPDRGFGKRGGGREEEEAEAEVRHHYHHYRVRSCIREEYCICLEVIGIACISRPEGDVDVSLERVSFVPPASGGKCFRL